MTGPQKTNNVRAVFLGTDVVAAPIEPNRNIDWL